ncbi:MAG TPA: PIN domain-containing protein [Casimicrobiaceae bacterium]|nr:PIN domain-containing protein [Casimicrobiaceae bacterium]
MILVDTSVWIDLFRDRKTPPTTHLRNLLDEGGEFGVTPVIVQEILQGAADVREFMLLNDYFSSQRMLTPEDPLRTHCQAARLYFDCRRRGFTPRSTIDCFIAQIALEHRVPLLHADRDFERIAKVAPQLKIV